MRRTPAVLIAGAAAVVFVVGAGSASAQILPPPTLPGPTTTTTTRPPPAPAPGPAPTIPPPTGPPTTPPHGPGPVPPPGPTTSTTAPATPPPTVDPQAMKALLAGVQNDLARLDAINAYVGDKGAVAASQAEAADAGSVAGTASDGERNARSAVAAAEAGVGTNVRRLSGLALALYMRFDLGFSPTPQDALTTAALNRGEMLSVVVERGRGQLADARRQLDDAQKALQQARDRARQARIAQAAAQQTLTADQARLAEHRLAAAGHPVKPPPGIPLPTIMGPAALTADELAGWFASRGFAPNVTVPMPVLAGFYLDAAKREGVRGDIAFAQSIIETGYFTFPTGGQLLGTDNNFAGIGACDSCAHGWHFPDARTGVAAQLQLLHAYASRTRVPTPLVGSVGVAGCCPTWLSLTGVWATAPDYGFIILTVYKQMLDWAIPQRLAAAGL